MTLPDGFQWTRVLPGDVHATSMLVNGVEVCRLMDRVNGSWFVYLNRHLPPPAGRVVHRSRDCSSFEQGRAGCEVWAARHEARLREETAAIAYKLAVDRGRIRGDRW